MKNILFALTLSIMSSCMMAYSVIIRQNVEPIEVEPSRPVALAVIPKVEIKAPVIKVVAKNHYAFLEAVGMRESSGNYKAVNRFGYLGKYQFGRETLNGLGYSNISNRQFLNNPDLQEQVMEDLLVHNKKLLRRYIEKYDGKVIHGVYITESGILAAAHLAGAGSVRKFFKKGYEFKDGFGTKMTSYIKKFNGYQLDI